MLKYLLECHRFFFYESKSYVGAEYADTWGYLFRFPISYCKFMRYSWLGRPSAIEKIRKACG